MSYDLKHEDRLARLADALTYAPAVTPALISGIVADACTRLAVLKKAGKTARIDALIAAGAWSDVALALIEIEQPAWKLRRLVHEDGAWFCSLSSQPNLPATLDDTADAWHENLPLALLCAFVEARRRSGVAQEANSPAAPQIRDNAVFCDNFA